MNRSQSKNNNPNDCNGGNYAHSVAILAFSLDHGIVLKTVHKSIYRV